MRLNRFPGKKEKKKETKTALLPRENKVIYLLIIKNCKKVQPLIFLHSFFPPHFNNTTDLSCNIKTINLEL